MNITVNNKTQLVAEDSTNLTSLIKQLKINDTGIAIAINLTVVSKSDWHKTILKENDNITIIKATQGG